MPGYRMHPSRIDRRQWAQLKRQAWLECNGQPICPRCHHPISGPLNRMDLGHTYDHATATPGQPNPLRLEHAQCNRRAGQQLGVELRMLRRFVSPFTTTELTR